MLLQHDELNERNFYNFNVSIPQAVGVVATSDNNILDGDQVGFNTVSGRYCCNAT